MRKKYSPEFKAKVAIEAIKEGETLAALSSKHEVHRVQIQLWKKEALELILAGFAGGKKLEKSRKESEDLTDALYRQIGQLKVENDWLKKNLTLDLEGKKMAIDMAHPSLSINRQCSLLGLSKGALHLIDLSYYSQDVY